MLWYKYSETVLSGNEKEHDMEKTDMRFDQNVFKELIGKRFNKICCDEFIYTPSVTQIAGLYIGDDIFRITNELETVDYFGTCEEIAVCRFSKCNNEDIKSALVAGQMTDTPVNSVIRSIKIVNEHQNVILNGEQEYDVWLTRGIIFTIEDREVSFEKSIVPFSEEINIHEGNNLIALFGKEEFTEGWDRNVKAIVERETITL